MLRPTATASRTSRSSVPSAEEAYRNAVQRGAIGVSEPHWLEDEFGRVELAAIATYGENHHTFVNRDDYAGPYLPGYVWASDDGIPARGLGLEVIDHVVGNVELGRMDHWVQYYERCLGFTELIHFSDEAIHTEYSALMSKVMMDGDGKIKFPINEPAEGKRKSQIEEYLDFYGGPGVQHVALQSQDIVRPSRSSRTAASSSSRRPTRTTTSSRSAWGRSSRTTTSYAGCGSSPTATRRATCSRSSRSPRRTGRRCSSR